MPIEFRCPQCSKLLRTPDESAGKRAKCPQCSAIVDVPTGPGTPPFPDLSVDGSADHTPTSPFGAVPAGDTAQPVNPYASPETSAAIVSPFAAKLDLQPRQISFDEVLRASWGIFRAHLGEIALLGVILFAAQIGMQMINQGAQFAIQASGEPVVMVIGGAGSVVINTLIQCFLGMGTVIYMLKLVRTRHAEINDVFGAGPLFLKGILVNIGLFLVAFGGVLVCILPGVISVAVDAPDAVIFIAMGLGITAAVVFSIAVSLRFMLCFHFLIDRQLSVGDSFRESARFMKGNQITTALLMIVVGFLGGVFALVTCCCGQILSVPYLALVVVLIYLSATSQPFAVPTS